MYKCCIIFQELLDKSLTLRKIRQSYGLIVQLKYDNELLYELTCKIKSMMADILVRLNNGL